MFDIPSGAIFVQDKKDWTLDSGDAQMMERLKKYAPTNDYDYE